MNYGKSPTNEKEAKAYAAEMTALHGKPWVAIKRTEPINNRFAINFAAEPQDELMVEGWEAIK